MKNTTNAASRTLTDSEMGDVTSALEILLSVVATSDLGDGTLPASLDKCNDGHLQALVVRSLNCYQAKVNEGQREVMKAAKAGIDGKIAAARKAKLDAFRVIHEMLVKNPDVGALLGDKAKPPTSAYLPASEIVEFFPDGMSIETILATAHRMGYKLTPGASKTDEKRFQVTISPEQFKAAMAETA